MSNVKEIKVGEVNDCHFYAMKTEHGGYVELSKRDMEFEQPDAKIYYDSGIYPGVSDLPTYICGKAARQ